MAYAGHHHGQYSPEGLGALPLAVLEERFDADLDHLRVPSRTQGVVLDDLIGCIAASGTFFMDAGVDPEAFVWGIAPKDGDYLPPSIS